jgi:hypothetical protein
VYNAKHLGNLGTNFSPCYSLVHDSRQLDLDYPFKKKKKVPVIPATWEAETEGS